MLVPPFKTMNIPPWNEQNIYMFWCKSECNVCPKTVFRCKLFITVQSTMYGQITTGPDL